MITHNDLIATLADPRCGWRHCTDGVVRFYARANGTVIVACEYPGDVHDSMTAPQIRAHQERLISEWVFGNQQQENEKGGSIEG